LAKIEGELVRLLDVYLDASITKETFTTRKADLEVRQQKITAELAALDATQQAMEAGALDLRAVRDYFVQWADQLDTITPEQQAQCIRAFGIVATWTPGQPLAMTGAIDVPIDSSALCYTPGHGGTLASIRSALL
jgi:hypothetical protein